MFKGEVELEAELEDLMSILAESELESEAEAELTPAQRTRAREVASDQIRNGVTDENRVADAVFYDLNPTWKDKKLPAGASKALRDAWTEIRNRIVRPLVKEMSCSGWERDPQSFAKRAVEHHLKGSGTVRQVVQTAGPPNWSCNVLVDGADGSTTLTVQLSPAEKLVRVGPASGGPVMCYQYRCVAANVVLQDAACPGPASEFEAELEDLMSTLSATDLESEAEWEAEGAARVPAGRCTPTGTHVGSFTCSDAEHASVENLLQMSIPPATLRAAVETSANAVVLLINTAAATLDRPSRTAASRAAFCAAFGVTPEFVPAWRSTLKGVVKWRDLGELVAIRLRDAAKIIDGGCIRYFCWGSAAHCPECTDAPTTYISCSSFRGRYTICLGDGFWQAWQAGDTVTTDLNLLHEALHIYFSTTVAHTGRTGNAYCYQSYVANINGLTIPQRITDRCPVGVCT